MTKYVWEPERQWTLFISSSLKKDIKHAPHTVKSEKNKSSCLPFKLSLWLKETESIDSIDMAKMQYIIGNKQNIQL